MEPKPQRIEVRHKGKTYVIIRDDEGVIGIEYDNAVQGRRRLFLDGKLAKELARAYPQHFNQEPRSTVHPQLVSLRARSAFRDQLVYLG